MKITPAAADAILKVMAKKGLNPKKFFLEIGVFEGNLGLGFTDERHGKVLTFGNLSVVIAHNVDTTGAVVDFGEIDGRKGLLFTGEQDVNHADRESGTGS